jgi:outer membrane protein assembly factor BamB
MTDRNITPEESRPEARGGRPGRRRAPPAWVWAVVTVQGMAALVVHQTDLLGDHGKANVTALVLVCLAVLTVLGWFVVLSGWSRGARLGLLAAVVAAVAGFFAVFRLDHFSGDLVPSFALRYAAKPDQTLALPQEAAATVRPPIDLSTITPQDFPQFLGPSRSASVEGVRLATDAAMPRLPVWRQPIGAGWSGFSVRNGHAVTMEQRGEQELVTCYEVRTGRLEWFHATATRYEGTAGGVGPRSTPTIHGGKVFALGAGGDLLCLDGATGRCLWEKNLLRQFGVTPEEDLAVVAWGRAASPLVVGDRVIVPAGGNKDGEPVSLAAFDARDGRLLWEGGRRQISYSSPALATLAGAQQILIVNEDTASGHDVQTGRVLWETKWDGRSNRDPNVSQAVPVPPDRVFLSKGYNQGAMLLGLVPKADGAFDTEVVWQDSKVMKTKFTNVTIRDGCVYGLSDGILECIDLASGRRIWKKGRYEQGQLLRAGEVLVVMSESGEIVLVEATPDRPNHVFGRFQALQDTDRCWNTIALAGPYLLVRNAGEAACYKLGIRN